MPKTGSCAFHHYQMWLFTKMAKLTILLWILVFLSNFSLKQDNLEVWQKHVCHQAIESGQKNKNLCTSISGILLSRNRWIKHALKKIKLWQNPWRDVLIFLGFLLSSVLWHHYFLWYTTAHCSKIGKIVHSSSPFGPLHSKKKTILILAFEANKAVWLPQILLFFGFCNTVVLIQSFPIFAARMFFLINHAVPISDVSGTRNQISGYPDSGFSRKNGFNAS